MKELRETIHNATLTKTQKLIAKYVLDNSADACFMTSTDIADTLGVSESSVVRFSRSLGYSGFMEFQKSLRKDYQDKVLSISSSITVPSQRVAKQAKLETNSDYIKRHYKNTTKNLDTIFSQNATSAFDEAANIIINSRHKYIVASRGNACLGDYFLLYLKHMVRGVESTSSASISPIDHMCKMACDAGAQVILFTDKPSALLAPYATVLITVPVDSNAFFNSLVAPQFACEALLDTISHHVKGIEKRLKKIDQYLSELGTY